MDQLSALTVLAIVFGVSNVLGMMTRARISMLFICSAILLLGFWNGLPTTLFEDSGFVPLSMSFIALLMVQMGSMMDARRMREEWKTVAVSFLGMCGAAIGVLIIAAPFITWDYAVAATGPVSGGVVAGLIMNAAADAKGLTEIGVFITILLTVQTLVGVPVASNCLLHEGKKLKERFASGERLSGSAGSSEAPEKRKKLFPATPEKWQSDYVGMAKAFIVAWLGVKAAALTSNAVHPFVMTLIFGILAQELGFIEVNITANAHASGFIMYGTMVPLFINLSRATPAMVFGLLKPIFFVFTAALIGICLASVVLSKIFKYSWSLSTALGVTCLFGFPGTLIVSEEITNQLAESEEEKEFILGNILPKMLIAGFTTVTIASVFLAGFLVKFF